MARDDRPENNPDIAPAKVRSFALLGHILAQDVRIPPELGSSPPITAIKEDFPDPEGPVTATISPD